MVEVYYMILRVAFKSRLSRSLLCKIIKGLYKLF